MLLLALALLIPGFARSAGAALQASGADSSSDVVPGKFIVEFDPAGHQSGYASVSRNECEVLLSMNQPADELYVLKRLPSAIG